jgi:hypothetical protein
LQRPEDHFPVRFHPTRIGQLCIWRDVIKPLSYLVFHDDDLKAFVARLPVLKNFESMSLDDWKLQLSDPSDNAMLDVLEAVYTLRS